MVRLTQPEILNNINNNMHYMCILCTIHASKLGDRIIIIIIIISPKWQLTQPEILNNINNNMHYMCILCTIHASKLGDRQIMIESFLAVI